LIQSEVKVASVASILAFVELDNHGCTAVLVGFLLITRVYLLMACVSANWVRIALLRQQQPQPASKEIAASRMLKDDRDQPKEFCLILVEIADLFRRMRVVLGPAVDL
jgi:hypothetical protein